MPNILTRILAAKAEAVEAARRKRPEAELRAAVADLPPTRSLRRSIERTPGGIIAEFKRRSPSKDWICRDAKPEAVIPAYEKAGAAALSILTDEPFFGGSTADIVAARPLTSLPILRKEFVVDSYQLLEARAVGADAVLLIAAALGATRCRELAAEARSLGLEVLLEIHEAAELAACSSDVNVLGVNNRDLKVFRTDPQRSADLLPLLPDGSLPISESGLLDPLVARRLHDVGFRGFLVGEAFMRTPQPGTTLREYLQKLLACS